MDPEARVLICDFALKYEICLSVTQKYKFTSNNALAKFGLGCKYTKIITHTTGMGYNIRLHVHLSIAEMHVCRGLIF